MLPFSGCFFRLQLPWIDPDKSLNRLDERHPLQQGGLRNSSHNSTSQYPRSGYKTGLTLPFKYEHSPFGARNAAHQGHPKCTAANEQEGL